MLDSENSEKYQYFLVPLHDYSYVWYSILPRKFSLSVLAKNLFMYKSLATNEIFYK